MVLAIAIARPWTNCSNEQFRPIAATVTIAAAFISKNASTTRRQRRGTVASHGGRRNRDLSSGRAASKPSTSQRRPSSRTSVCPRRRSAAQAQRALVPPRCSGRTVGKRKKRPNSDLNQRARPTVGAPLSWDEQWMPRAIKRREHPIGQTSYSRITCVVIDT